MSAGRIFTVEQSFDLRFKPWAVVCIVGPLDGEGKRGVCYFWSERKARQAADFLESLANTDLCGSFGEDL